MICSGELWNLTKFHREFTDFFARKTVVASDCQYHSACVCVSYLEELSRRYKRQMEEMYASLNRTISKLSNTAKIAAEQVIVLLSVP